MTTLAAHLVWDLLCAAELVAARLRDTNPRVSRAAMALPACCTADVSCSGYAYPASSSPAEFYHHTPSSVLVSPTLCCAVLAGYNITYTLTHLQDVNTY